MQDSGWSRNSPMVSGKVELEVLLRLPSEDYCSNFAVVLDVTPGQRTDNHHRC